MNSDEYKEKLKDPRWIARREQILLRDESKCIICHERKRSMHVHHLRYTNGCEPWEYPDSNFVTLCPHHHELAHDEMARSRAVDLLLGALRKRKANALEIIEFAALAVAFETRWQKTVDEATAGKP